MKNFCRKLTQSILITLYALGAGCAVLTVDVDVYKGTLANTEQIQGEQVISMAMGAKPLLVQLRDHLEVAEPPPPVGLKAGEPPLNSSDSTLQGRLRAWRANKWYNPGYIQQPGLYPPSKMAYALHNEFAIRVNDILALYEDQAPRELVEPVSRALQLAASYETNYRLVHPKTGLAEEQRWTRLAKAMSTPSEPKRDSTQEQKRTKLQNAYREFFLRDGDLRFQAKVFNVLAEDQAFERSNEQFSQLLNGRAQAHADLLFSTPSPEKAEFVAYVESVATAFVQARDDLHQLMRLALESIPEAHHSTILSPDRRVQVQQAAARVAASLINLQDLANNAPADLKALLDNNLSLRPNKLTVDRIKAGNPKLNQVDWAEAESTLSDLLSADNGRLSKTILDIDNSLRNSNNRIFSYGLARGPVAPFNDASSGVAPSVEEIATLTAGLQAAGGGSLSRGRAPLGIETLIENYLKLETASKQLPKRNETVEFIELLEGLVNFAQKVSSLGNSATLLEGGNAANAREYVTVLQSVGNSILVHVDELKSQMAHQGRLKERSQIIGQAIKDYGGFTKGGFENWDNQSNRSAKDASEQLVNILRIEYIKALREGDVSTATTNLDFAVTIDAKAGEKGTNISASAVVKSGAGSADKFLQAIQAATEFRSGMIYLRPASSYLRSSYPATTLQRNRSQAWRNMLQEHGLRQTPFIGGWLSGEIGESTRTIAEIDQQSWQSVNRVRVAGAGSANYVVAKDDVGNWYVKNYSANPTNIFNSMRNLALFSAGGSFGGQLPIRKQDGTVLKSTNSVLSVQFNQATTKYLSQSSNSFIELTKRIKDIETALSSAINRAGLSETNQTNIFQIHSNSFSRVVVHAVTNAPRPEASASELDQSATYDMSFRSVLRALKRHHRLLILALEAPLSISPPEEEKKRDTLRNSLSLITRDYLDEAVQERERALGRYEGALDVISGASNGKKL
jgi:hypothetical protein